MHTQARARSWRGGASCRQEELRFLLRRPPTGGLLYRRPPIGRLLKCVLFLLLFAVRCVLFAVWLPCPSTLMMVHVCNRLSSKCFEMLSWPLDGLMRAANTASPLQLQKIVRSNLTCLDAKLYGQASFDLICSSYEELIIDLLQATQRPTPKALEQAAKAALDDADQAACRQWSVAVCDAITYCRNKTKSMTSGSRLEPAVLKICRLLNTLRAPVGESLMRKARDIESAQPGKRKAQAMEAEQPLEGQGKLPQPSPSPTSSFQESGGKSQGSLSPQALCCLIWCLL